ncbi:unnamed protein product [Ambrosiozyma monospora]|uniref:Unnamed protein product n=1 Tax=Ambrosiozyma monospora TaxID=43982 RepID=A0ACB5TQN6_AMBMO|nr:unnamed protein product [Ambrosiozyma monospora]
MVSEKSMLKDAKRALQRSDFDETVSICDHILELNSNCYFAYLYKGKALTSLGDMKLATKCYFNATKIKPDDPLCWKGLLFISRMDKQYKHFLANLTGYTKALSKNHQELSEAVEFLRAYKQRYKGNQDEFNMAYLKAIIPGMSELGDAIGPMMAKPSISLKQYIILKEKRESDLLEKDVRKMKMSLPAVLNAKNQAKVDNLYWSHYKQSEIPSLQEKLINIEDDDISRREAEEKLLKVLANLHGTCTLIGLIQKLFRSWTSAQSLITSKYLVSRV